MNINVFYIIKCKNTTSCFFIQITSVKIPLSPDKKPEGSKFVTCITHLYEMFRRLGFLPFPATVVFLLVHFNCSYQKKIKNGETAYELKQFAKAVDMLQEEFHSYVNPSHKARTAFLLGKSYEKLLDYTAALEWYEEADSHRFGPEAMKQKAIILKQLERYQESYNLWESLKNIPDYRILAEREMLLCREALRWKNTPEPMHVENFIESSGFSHYSPVFFRDEYLLISSDRPEAFGKKNYKWSGNKFSDLFLFSKSGNYLSPFDPSINSEHNEGTPCFTKDFLTIYFTRCQRSDAENDYCKLMTSTFEDGVWTEPVTLPFTKEKVQYGHPVLFENDSVLIFSSDLAEPGGTFDLYYSEITTEGNWSEPYPLPKTINTDGNEKFPTADGDTLYFSSDFLPGMGGLDIFKTFLRQDGRWSPPQNMKYPLNSGADDFSLIIDRKFKKTGNMEERGFFTTSRSKKGIDEIYSYTRYAREDIKPKSDTIPAKEKIFYYITGRTFGEKFTNDNPNLPKLADIILPDTRVQLYNQEGKLIEETRTNQTGIFIFKAEPGQWYTLKAAKPQYLTTTEEADLSSPVVKSGEDSYSLQVNILLQGIYLDKEVILDNIYYEFDEWNLTPEAYPTLEKLTNILITNPTIQIQLNSHTDCRGDDEYNMELSRKRARSVVNFLVSKGIREERMIPVGHGETNPLMPCPCSSCTEEEHQKNRRTSFTIISVGK